MTRGKIKHFPHKVHRKCSSPVITILFCCCFCFIKPVLECLSMPSIDGSLCSSVHGEIYILMYCTYWLAGRREQRRWITFLTLSNNFQCWYFSSAKISVACYSIQFMFSNQSNNHYNVVRTLSRRNQIGMWLGMMNPA